ncbi:DUF222 domain-containing protein [Cellulomonas sp. IC4_254]|uniref:DUF222 domain-containing protein n=1 Tax=Cellulomonas sp. IC4_254 TaxID=2714040 RepID=UPI0014222CA0|nr:DUF222 domain-containing protein [Cellulomonas sp. IC4_254]NHT17847.1 DUF222 domain-containing protein [Cellulomonas sp. IC4_254]
MVDLQEHPDGDAVAAGVLPVYGPDGTCLTDYGPDPVMAAGGAPRTGEQRQVEAIASCPPGPVLDAWLRGLDLKVLPSAVVVQVIAARVRMQAHQHAAMLEAVAELASRPEMRPDWSPLAGAPPTQPCVAGDELSMRLGWARVTATKVVHRALVLDGMLVATGEALASGHLDAAKAEVLAAGLADLPYQAAHAVEDAVLPDAAQCSARQLARRVEQEVRLVDPDGAAGRGRRARCTRRVTHPRPQPHGMASMWVVMAAEDATRVDGVLDHTARAAKALGDERTLDQLRADGLRDLVVGDVPSSDGPAFEVHLDPPAPVLPAPRRSSPWPVTTTRGRLVHPRPVEPVPTATLVPLAGSASAGSHAPPTATVPHTAAPHDGPAHAATTAPAALGPGTPVIEPALTAATPSPDPGVAEHAEPDGRAEPTERASGQRGCGGRCTGRPGAEVRLTISASTLLGLDDQPADLDGYGPIDAVRARALAAGGVWRRVVTDPVTGQVLDVGRTRYRPPPPSPSTSAPATGPARRPGARSRPGAPTWTTPPRTTPTPAPTPPSPWAAPTPTTSDPCAGATTAPRPTAGTACARSAPDCSSGSPPLATGTSPAPAPAGATTPPPTPTTHPRRSSRGSGRRGGTGVVGGGP